MLRLWARWLHSPHHSLQDFVFESITLAAQRTKYNRDECHQFRRAYELAYYDGYVEINAMLEQKPISLYHKCTLDIKLEEYECKYFIYRLKFIIQNNNLKARFTCREYFVYALLFNHRAIIKDNILYEFLLFKFIKRKW